MSRLASAGEEISTVVFAEAILGAFQLSAISQVHLNEALRKLKSFFNARNLMDPSFLVKYIVHFVADSVAGMTTIAICAAVTEVHSLKASTFIIQEYAQLCGTGTKLFSIPSYRQWEILVKGCSGILAQSPFRLAFDFFKAICPRAETQNAACGGPKQVALALRGLAMISKGDMKSMKMKGSSECALLAAIAQWVLDLKVVIQYASGHIVYPGTEADVDDYHLMITYSDNTDTCEPVSGAGSLYGIDQFSDIISKRTIAKSLRDRIEWATALRDTFGSSAIILLQSPTILGSLFGNVAKLHSYTPKSMALNNISRPCSTGFGPKLSGRSFVDLACELLPELVASKNSMNKILDRPDDEACLQFERTSAILKKLCVCAQNCCPPNFMELTSQPLLNEPSTFARNNGNYCLWLLALTAIQLVRQVSILASMPADLLPRRCGLEDLYEMIRKRSMEEFQGADTLFGALGSIDLPDFASLLFGFRSLTDDQMPPSQQSNGRSPVSNGGLCFILGSVPSLSGNAEEMSQVHTFLGHIEWDGKIYKKARGSKVESRESIIPTMILPTAKAGFEAQMQRIDGTTVRTVVSESFNTLRMSYEIGSAYYVIQLPARRAAFLILGKPTKLSIDSERSCLTSVDLERANSHAARPWWTALVIGVYNGIENAMHTVLRDH